VQNGFLQISYTQWQDATDLVYVVEVSNDLKTWNSGPAYTQQISATPLDPTRQQVVVRDLTPVSGSPHRFIRVRVTH